METRFKKVTIKIGSNVLTRQDGTLDSTRMSALVDQIAALHKQGVVIVLVSSGAVASGRSEMQRRETNKKLDSVSQRQLYSAIGQAKLINRYYELFREHGITVGQVLTTKESFATRRLYLNQKNCINTMIDNQVIPIVNENDTISVSELMFTDNDELSGLIASMIDAQALILLSNIDGIYNGSPDDPASEVIKEIEPGRDLSSYIQTTKSSFGRGGMLTKTTIARKVADNGIEVIIANGKREEILVNLLKPNSQTPCTRFLPTKGDMSSIKKWISNSEGFAKGELHLNESAVEALLGNRAMSILPIGVTHLVGTFEKDDIVRLITPQGRQIGVGKSSFDSQQAAELLGKHGKKALVHYDYLCLEAY